MNRRGFLRFFGKSSATVAGALVASQPLSGEVVEGHRGFVFQWSGWKASSNSEGQYGQWTARTPNLPYMVYASYPGWEGKYYEGYVFDISKKPGQKPILEGTPQAEKDAAKEECRLRLIATIDQILDAPQVEYIGSLLGAKKITNTQLGCTSASEPIMLYDVGRKW